MRRHEAGAKWTTELSAEGPSPAVAAQPDKDRLSVIDLDAVPAAIESLQAFLGGQAPRVRVACLEGIVAGADARDAVALLQRESTDDDVLRSALLVKGLAGEINVVIHALRILLALPHLLEADETVIYTSLGAGTGGRRHDLETTHRIAEFKFTEWRGHDAVRQRELFADFVNLAEADEARRRQPFVTGATRPLQFLLTSKRALTSVCERRPEILARIRAKHGDTFRTVADYAAATCDRVQITDLEQVLPAYIVREIARSEAKRRGSREDT